MRIVKLCGDDYREFAVGETVWIVYHTLVVRCVITEVDDKFRKKSPTAYLFYDVDEPIGHSLSEDELFLSKEEAMQVLQDELSAWQSNEHGRDDAELRASIVKRYHTDTLESVRRRNAAFIVSTHQQDKRYGKTDTDFVREHVPELLLMYPTKAEGIDWFRAGAET